MLLPHIRIYSNEQVNELAKFGFWEIAHSLEALPPMLVAKGMGQGRI